MGGTSIALSIKGLVLKSVDMGNVWSSCRLKNVGIAICIVWPELSELVGGVRITVQQ